MRRKVELPSPGSKKGLLAYADVSLSTISSKCPQSAHRAATKHVHKILPHAKTLEVKGERKDVAYCLSSLAWVIN